MPLAHEFTIRARGEIARCETFARVRVARAIHGLCAK
jgi:hypothetical protein